MSLDELLGGAGSTRRLAEFLRVDEVFTIATLGPDVRLGVRVGSVVARRDVSVLDFHGGPPFASAALFARVLTDLAAEARGRLTAGLVAVRGAPDVADWTPIAPTDAEIAYARYAQQLSERVSSSFGLPQDLLEPERPRALTRFEAIAEEMKDP